MPTILVGILAILVPSSGILLLRRRKVKNQPANQDMVLPDGESDSNFDIRSSIGSDIDSAIIPTDEESSVGIHQDSRLPAPAQKQEVFSQCSIEAGWKASLTTTIS